ncbi:MAG: hypothetical protein QXJ96_02830 [Candidatus Aenigmatarchaeota archaeon]
MKKRKKVSFLTTKRVPRRVKISFNTAYGKKVSFMATKRVPRRVKVIFYAKKRKKK